MVPVRVGSTTSEHLPNMAAGVLGSVVVAGLVAWRFNMDINEMLHGSWHVLLFALGSWLLYYDSWSPTPARQLINILGILFTGARFLQYTRLALILPEPPPQYAPLFSTSALGFSASALYTAVSTLMQVLLHRVFPGWACTLLGAAQALLFSRISYRYADAADVSAWRLLLMVVMPQIGMFAPYHCLNHPRIWKAFSFKAPVMAKASKKMTDGVGTATGTEASGAPTAALPSPELKPSSKDGKTCSCVKAMGSASAGTAGTGGGLTQDAAAPPAPKVPASSVASHEEAVGAAAPAADLTGKHSAAPVSAAAAASTVELTGAQCAAPSSTAGGAAQSSQARRQASAAAAVQAMKQAPYRSRLRSPHMVCVKLDTSLPCSSLPHDVAQQLQGALRASIGQATSLRISDVAVRPGCICITMKIEQPIHGSASQQAGAELCQQFASAIIPELQGMLSTSSKLPAFQRASVQLDDELVVMAWQSEQQAWDMQAVPHTQAACRAGLGLSMVRCMQKASVSLDEGVRAYPARAQDVCMSVDVLVETQLWGVSKVTNVEGWTPPQQHQDNELQWPGAQQPLGSSPALKLLARAAGGYLPTQLVRLVPGSTDGYVTAQVLVQLHEHQLVRHHEDGSPSTLLLMDLELWQNEVLLSSSPLLSLPAATETSRNSPATHAWWWGAADSTVAAAMAELEHMAQQCSAAAPEGEASAATCTYVQYVQDICAWLVHVQRTARHGRHCHCRVGYHTTTMCRHMLSPLKQPTLPPLALKQLGDQLMQYAEHLGCSNVYRMLRDQMRCIVLPATSQRSLTSNAVLAICRRAVRAALLGHPCRHCEALYKQRLAALHMNGVLVLSSGANVLVMMAWMVRAVPYARQEGLVVILGAALFAVFHLAAVVAALMGPQQNQQAAGKPSTATPLPLRLVRWAYVWRAVLRVILVLSAPPSFTTMFQDDAFWIPMQLLMAITAQVQAITVLPAPCVVLITLFVELPATLRAAPCKPLAAAVLILVRLVLDAYMRCRLNPTASRSNLASGRHVKTQ